MESGRISSWQMEEGKVKVVTDFLFLGSKIPVDGDCSHEIRRHLLLVRKAMTNLDSVLKAETLLFRKKVCIVNFYAEYIMRNAGLEETQAGIKIARRKINNLRYTDDTTLMAESEEELKSLLMKVKEESEKVGSTFRKRRSWHLVPSLHGK